MKKALIISFAVIFVMVMSIFLLPEIKKVTSLPDDMVVTYKDIEIANDTD